MSRVPITAEVGMKKLFCGPESFTPDFAPLVGEAPELKRLLRGGGLEFRRRSDRRWSGRVLANWIVTGNPDVDVTGFNIDRLHAYQANPDYRRQRTVESLGMVYQMPLPGDVAEHRAGRAQISIS